MTRALPAFDLAGTPYALGYQHGQLARARIRDFAADGFYRLNHILYEPTSLQALQPVLAAYREAIFGHLPAMAEEIAGLAEGAEISGDDALLLQLRRELLGYRRIPSRGDCTTFLRIGGADCVLAQTIDLNGNLEDDSYILRISHADGRAVMLLTFTGLLGYLGMNSHGLAIGLNLVLGGTWRPGIPGYMAIRYLLDTARSVADCIELLPRLPLASSRALTFCDGESAASVEILDNRLRWVQSTEFIRTNHYLDPEFARRDEINVFAKNGSMRRLDAVGSHLARTPRGAGVDDYFAILAQHPICTHPDGDMRHDATVAAVVMQPRERAIYIRKGPPCRSGATQRVAFP